MTTKENQHYIPQGYLRGFTISKEKSLVWEYDKESGEISNVPRALKSICSKRLYYVQYDQNGQMDRDGLENGFQIIENEVPRILRKIHPEQNGDRVSLSGKEHGALSFFVSLLLTRVPNFRDGVEGFHRGFVKRSLELYVTQARQRGQLPLFIKNLYEEGHLFDRLKVSVKPQVSLQPMIECARRGGRALLAKLWWFALPAPGTFFVTSDNPVYFQLPEKHRGPNAFGVGPFHPFSEVTIPLRKNLALICHPSVGYTEREAKLLQFQTVQLDSPGTCDINKRTALAARRYIYGPAKSLALARMIGELKGTQQCVDAD